MAAAIPFAASAIGSLFSKNPASSTGPLGSLASAQQGIGIPALRQASGYYGTLLNGNRSQMAAAVAPETANITDAYRGAATGLERSGMRGPALDVARGNLARDVAGKVGGLTLGLRPQAAGALTQIGQNATGQAQAGLSTLLQPQINSQNLDWSNIGATITNLLKSWQGRGSSGGGGTMRPSTMGVFG